MDAVGRMPGGPYSPEHLAMMHSQRDLLLGLHAEIEGKRRQLLALDPSEFWSSKSQRAYSGCVADIVQHLDVVLHYLHEAVASVRNQIYLEEELCPA
ncbi:hypothetical protein SAMN05216368_101187 [Cryobacterium flavum]|uniref:DUF664 domain-containing protein n=2 Tax=Cryobacterium flavum TaxID=1424659 RepID=A0A5E9FU64_9MICO|nr:hypothetical protein SAMN05216368_101187 [Cryobacterium flavum]